MAAGDVKAGLSSISAGGFLTIQPPIGEEWVVTNIYTPSAKPSELYFTDGTNDILVDTRIGGGWFGYAFHITYAYYIKVKNTDTAAQNIGYSGVQIK